MRVDKPAGMKPKNKTPVGRRGGRAMSADASDAETQRYLKGLLESLTPGRQKDLEEIAAIEGTSLLAVLQQIRETADEAGVPFRIASMIVVELRRTRYPGH